MSARHSWGPDALAAFGVFIVAMCVQRDVLDYAIFGWDSYATILASRVQGPGDLLGTFTELMMDGRLAVGDFYRPVGNIFIALDYGLWGLEPMGYQLTSVVVWAAGSAAAFGLARRTLGQAAWLGPLAVAAFYVLHPTVLSILPVPARRTELLQIVFMLGALLALPNRPDDPARTRRCIVAGGLALLAMASKESGLIVLPIMGVHQLLMATEGTPRARLSRALGALAPALIAAVAFWALRTAVIGGLGGYHESGDGTLFARLWVALPAYLSLVIATGPLDTLAFAPAFGVAAPLAIAGLGLAMLASCPRPWPTVLQRSACLAALGFSWLVAQIAISTTSFQLSPRYATGMVLALALMLGAGLEAALAALRALASNRSRAAAFATFALVTLIFSTALRGSPAWYAYPGFVEATQIQQGELGELARRLGGEPIRPRTKVSVRRQVGIFERAVDHAWMLSPWSLQAWFEMRFPDRPLRVELDNTVPRSPKVWHLVLVADTTAPAAGGSPK